MGALHHHDAIVVAHNDITGMDSDPSKNDRDVCVAAVRLGGRFRMKAPAEHLKTEGRDIGAVADRAIEDGADHAHGDATIREQVSERAEPLGAATIHDEDVSGCGVMDCAVDRAILARCYPRAAGTARNAFAGDQRLRACRV